jgi:coenzyme F420-reducing hydrogenase alpha subunit
MAPRTIEVGYLARVEGEGSMKIVERDGALEEVRFSIFEAPRFFEALLRGRKYDEAPDITSRICGICPVAYQTSATAAMEDALGIDLGERLTALRRLVYCGEWIESHALHLFLLHAPDFLGYEDGIAMARDHGKEVERGLQIKKIGNELISKLGGRAIHPINGRVGGYHSVPKPSDLAPIRERLLWARDEAVESVRWVGGLEFPDLERDYEMVSLHHPARYAIEEGRIVSNRGLDIEARDFEATFEEEQVPTSNAKHSRRKGGGAYLVGPMARYSNNFDQLSPIAKQAAADAGLGKVCRNPFKSIVVRAVEILYACDEAIRLIDAYEPPDAPAIEATPRASEGFGCTEAPRGALYHRYELNAEGRIVTANIVPPTAQNQASVEEDLRELVSRNLHLDDETLRRRCEQAIRNYDPCISCATHFLKLAVERR